MKKIATENCAWAEDIIITIDRTYVRHLSVRPSHALSFCSVKAHTYSTKLQGCLRYGDSTGIPMGMGWIWESDHSPLAYGDSMGIFE